MRVGLGLIALMCVVGCATTAPQVRIPPMPPEPPAAELPPNPPVASLPGDELARLQASDPIVGEVSPGESVKAMDRALRQAIVRPRREWFQGAVLTYPIKAGAVYSVSTREQQPTVLVF